MEVFAKLGSEGNWPLELHSLPAAVRGRPVGGPGHLPAHCLQVISYSCLLSAFPSSGPSSCRSSVWNSFLPFFTGGFCWFFKPLLEDTLLFQEALLAALRPPQAGWVGAPPVPPYPGIFDPALDLLPSLLPSSLGLRGRNSAGFISGSQGSARGWHRVEPQECLRNERVNVGHQGWAGVLGTCGRRQPQTCKVCFTCELPVFL